MISNHLRSNISNIKGANRLGNPRNSMAWSEFELNLQFTVSIPVYLLAWLMTVNRINWRFDASMTVLALNWVWTNIWVYLCLESLRAHNMFNLGTAFISDKFYWRFLLANVCSLAARIMSDIYNVNRLVTGPGPGRTLRHSNLAVTQI